MKKVSILIIFSLLVITGCVATPTPTSAPVTIRVAGFYETLPGWAQSLPAVEIGGSLDLNTDAVLINHYVLVQASDYERDWLRAVACQTILLVWGADTYDVARELQMGSPKMQMEVATYQVAVLRQTPTQIFGGGVANVAGSEVTLQDVQKYITLVKSKVK